MRLSSPLLSLSALTLLSSTLSTVSAIKGVARPYGRAPSASTPSPGISTNGLPFNNQTFDFVIVGGGTAGLVLANRLSADPNVTVCVIEAGASGVGDTTLTTPDAMLYNSSVGTSKDWQYTVEPQKGLNNRTIDWPRGKVLGGSSAINGMYLVRQPKVEQQGWVNLISNLSSSAADTWGWTNVLANMKKSEKFTAAEQNVVQELGESPPYDSSAHGQSGPIHHSFPGQEYAHVGAFLTATAQHLELNITSEAYSGNNSGPFLATSAINPSNWTRSFSRPAYLDPILGQRSNLFILTKHQVTRILFNTSASTPRATGVQCALSSTDWVHTVHASSEVILAAGSIGSPQLLQLSGVGDPDLLSSVGIDVVANVSGVGYHLQDHLSSTTKFQPANSSIALPPDHVTGNAVKDSYVNSATAYVPLSKLVNKDEFLANLTSSTDTWVSAYDAPASVQEGYRASLEQLAHTFYAADAPAVEILWSVQWGKLNVQCALQHPTSQGSLRIQSSSPWDKPSLNPNYAQHALDLKILRRGCQMARQIAHTAPLAHFIGDEMSPGANVTSTSQWDAYLQASSGTEYHPSSTCSLLPYDLGGVVDDKLRVYRTHNLRVVDSSVPPISFSQHLMTITYAIAEIGATLILQSQQ